MAKPRTWICSLFLWGVLVSCNHLTCAARLGPERQSTTSIPLQGFMKPKEWARMELELTGLPTYSLWAGAAPAVDFLQTSRSVSERGSQQLQGGHWQCACADKSAVAWIRDLFFDCVSTPWELLSFSLGLSSILFWLVAQLPQFIQNIRMKSAEALSPWFLFQWLSGDMLNLLGCLLTGTQLATQTYTAVYFIFADCCIISQYVFYQILNREKKELEADCHSNSGSFVTVKERVRTLRSLRKPLLESGRPEAVLQEARLTADTQRNRSPGQEPYSMAAAVQRLSEVEITEDEGDVSYLALPPGKSRAVLPKILAPASHTVHSHAHHHALPYGHHVEHHQHYQAPTALLTGRSGAVMIAHALQPAHAPSQISVQPTARIASGKVAGWLQALPFTRQQREHGAEEQASLQSPTTQRAAVGMDAPRSQAVAGLAEVSGSTIAGRVPSKSHAQVQATDDAHMQSQRRRQIRRLVEVYGLEYGPPMPRSRLTIHHQRGGVPLQATSKSSSQKSHVGTGTSDHRPSSKPPGSGLAHQPLGAAPQHSPRRKSIEFSREGGQGEQKHAEGPPHHDPKGPPDLVSSKECLQEQACEPSPDLCLTKEGALGGGGSSAGPCSGDGFREEEQDARSGAWVQEACHPTLGQQQTWCVTDTADGGGLRGKAPPTSSLALASTVSVFLVLCLLALAVPTAWGPRGLTVLLSRQPTSSGSWGKDLDATPVPASALLQHTQEPSLLVAPPPHFWTLSSARGSVVLGGCLPPKGPADPRPDDVTKLWDSGPGGAMAAASGASAVSSTPSAGAGSSTGAMLHSLGLILGWGSAVFYLASRVSQIALNAKRGSAEGLSMAMFVCAFCANCTYGSAILLRAHSWSDLTAKAPWLIGSVGTLSLDVAIYMQAWYLTSQQERAALDHDRRGHHKITKLDSWRLLREREGEDGN